MILVGTRNGVVEVCVSIEPDYVQTLQAMYPDLVFTERAQGVPVGGDAAITAARTFTKLEWMDRFTHDELTAIYSAARASVAVEVWLERYRQCPYVDPADPRTAAGLQALEAVGILAAGRAAEILG